MQDIVQGRKPRPDRWRVHGLIWSMHRRFLFVILLVSIILLTTLRIDTIDNIIHRRIYMGHLNRLKSE